MRWTKDTFWKLAGPVFAALVLGAIGIAGSLFESRVTALEAALARSVK